MRCCIWAAILGILPLFAAAAEETAPRESTVGMSVRIEQLVLPGGELEAVPNDDRKMPIVLRIIRVYPHGDAFRYDLEYYALEPGRFDLKTYLRRKDGSATTGLPSIPLHVTPLLPSGQITPNPLEIDRPGFLGGYRTWLLAAGVIWGLGFVSIVYFGFVRRRRPAAEAVSARPVSLADRLRPLIAGAIDGKLSQAQLASLERGLLAFWRKRLHLEDSDPAAAIEQLRRHAEAGPLLEQLERWLHRPEMAASVDPAALLGPYQHLRAEELEESP